MLRFAPSPNGYLHLGHAYSALFTWRAAAEIGGVALLRIEDTDITRCKPEFADAIMEDLAWLGLAWPEPVLYQSERFPIYAAAAERLAALDLVYPCFCSRSEIAAAATARDPDGAPLYPGTCRHLSREQVAERLARGDPVQYRLKSDRAIALAGSRHFRVAEPDVTGPVLERLARPERWGDVVIQRKGTPTSYHLSVVVDDAAQGITHVTRGRDMEAATDFHVLLQALLELPAPIYTFHPLILDREGKKLSKSRSSESLRALRAAGWSADDIRRHLGFA
ncbi:tRNA glutamyl-Q(34) synthetase GluQRS [Youhaiella tibetensis]|uniref:tRNA glutamyl-Q(34) synthetase GluQRS n=1 Tax=Paradevosia tibetensis TaxID=1447062 RepID=A0A5B9DW74_9HYPH|nr:tRNA glutamyl-Q(34) synthetase GluQRS [Youhaiella tibetensis]QEE22873.1 tRNA glutamyl-Q(34) synthetase GluQRS [Youhaiella tibetensis]